MNGYRLEKDSIGSKQVPKSAYYGVQTLRALENFSITGIKPHREIIRSLAYVKKACAIANYKAEELSEEISNAIVKACDDVLDGHLHEHFVVDVIQGGAGTSLNMNANEVIANRAIEHLGGERGDYSILNSLDHVNFGQSTNDVIPTAGKITVIQLINQLIEELKILEKELSKKSIEFDDVIKVGRTQLQDAVPIRLGQEFHAYAKVVSRDINRLEKVKFEMYAVNLGGTAVGTGLNANVSYFKNVVPVLAEITGFSLYQCEDVIDGTQNLDGFVAVSGTLKTCAVSLSKMANDLRLMSSGPRAGIGEINLPAKQNGSSIMPGKVNPVIPEVVSQVAFLVIGNDMTVTMGAEGGQLELNAFEPVIFKSIFESIEAMKGAVKTFVDNCIVGITANKDKCRDMVENNVGLITALAPHVGYEKSAEVAKQAIKTGESVADLAVKAGLATREELDIIFNSRGMTEPGISAEYLLHKNNK